MYLIFDTETTGFPFFNKSPEDASQPHIIQLAALLLDEDFKELESFNTLVKPEMEFYISRGAFEAHKITKERVIKEGMPSSKAMVMLSLLSIRAQQYIAHNIKFDSFLVDIAFCRAGLNLLNWQNSFCTMQATTPLCKLHRKNGAPKWPKLQEAYKHFFGEEFEGAHDALADVRACAKVFQKLRQPVETRKEAVTV